MSIRHILTALVFIVIVFFQDSSFNYVILKGRLKLQDRKMQDWKLTDKNYRGWKMTDMV